MSNNLLCTWLYLAHITARAPGHERAIPCIRYACSQLLGSSASLTGLLSPVTALYVRDAARGWQRSSPVVSSSGYHDMLTLADYN